MDDVTQIRAYALELALEYHSKDGAVYQTITPEHIIVTATAFEAFLNKGADDSMECSRETHSDEAIKARYESFAEKIGKDKALGALVRDAHGRGWQRLPL